MSPTPTKRECKHLNKCFTRTEAKMAINYALFRGVPAYEYPGFTAHIITNCADCGKQLKIVPVPSPKLKKNK